MTFKDLQRLVESEANSGGSNSPEMQKLLARLRDKPFWINSEKEHKERDRTSKGDCCFNHINVCPLSLQSRKGPVTGYQAERRTR
jgi:hypothetical protein